MTTRLVTGALLLALSATPGLAQSYNAPAGIPAAAAPGGLQGRAALPNLIDAGEGRVRAVTPRGYDDDLATGSVRSRRDARSVHGR